jgi:hypothetical protein
MTNATTKTYLIGVIERALAYYEVEAEDARTAAENWQDGEFHDRDDEALDSEGPRSVWEKHPDGEYRKVPVSQWESVVPGSEDERLKKAAPDLLELARQVVVAKDTEESVPVHIYHAAVRIIALIEDDQA